MFASLYLCSYHLLEVDFFFWRGGGSFRKKGDRALEKRELRIMNYEEYVNRTTTPTQEKLIAKKGSLTKQYCGTRCLNRRSVMRKKKLSKVYAPAPTKGERMIGLPTRICYTCASFACNLLKLIIVSMLRVRFSFCAYIFMNPLILFSCPSTAAAEYIPKRQGASLSRT